MMQRIKQALSVLLLRALCSLVPLPATRVMKGVDAKYNEWNPQFSGFVNHITGMIALLCFWRLGHGL